MPERSPPQFTVQDIDDEEIPDPHSSRGLDYQQIVDDALARSQSKKMTCEDERSAHAVYVGIMRAINRTGATNIRATTRRSTNGTSSVFLAVTRPKAARSGQPNKE